jgi:hypothetical protein
LLRNKKQQETKRNIMGWQTERDKLRTEMQVVFLCPTKKQQLHRTSTEPLEKRISGRKMRHL